MLKKDDRRTKATVHKELDETVAYAPGELDRDVVSKLRRRPLERR